MRLRFRCLHGWNPEKNSCVSRFLHLGERFYFVPFRACVSFVFVYCRVNGRPKRKNILAFSLAALSCKRTLRYCSVIPGIAITLHVYPAGMASTCEASTFEKFELTQFELDIKIN